jgi:hypothetical protein
MARIEISKSSFSQLQATTRDLVTSDLSTHLGEWLFLGDVSILGCFLAARLSLVLLAEADRPEGPLFLLEANKRAP